MDSYSGTDLDSRAYLDTGTDLYANTRADMDTGPDKHTNTAANLDPRADADRHTNTHLNANTFSNGYSYLYSNSHDHAHATADEAPDFGANEYCYSRPIPRNIWCVGQRPGRRAHRLFKRQIFRHCDFRKYDRLCCFR